MDLFQKTQSAFFALKHDDACLLQGVDHCNDTHYLGSRIEKQCNLITECVNLRFYMLTTPAACLFYPSYIITSLSALAVPLICIIMVFRTEAADWCLVSIERLVLVRFRAVRREGKMNGRSPKQAARDSHLCIHAQIYTLTHLHAHCHTHYHTHTVTSVHTHAVHAPTHTDIDAHTHTHTPQTHPHSNVHTDCTPHTLRERDTTHTCIHTHSLGTVSRGAHNSYTSSIH